MDFWLPLIYSGAKAMGLNELDYVLFESGHLQYPNEFIDTKSSKLFNNELKNSLLEEYYKKPRSKRVDYLGAGFLTPFYFPINSILNLSKANQSFENNLSYFVLRNRIVLTKLSKWFFNRNKQEKFHLEKEFNQNELELIEQSFLSIRLSVEGTGRSEKFSLIYLDKKRDELDLKNALQGLLDDNRKAKLKEKEIDLDKLNKPSAKNQEEHKAMRKSLDQLIKADYDKKDLLTNEEAFFGFMSKLDATSNGKPIGFITNGMFSLRAGRFMSNAFILSKCILDKIIQSNGQHETKTKNKTFYFRSPNSKDFKSASIDEILI